MAKLTKKWGAVIGCWCVALVLIVTGICLGLTIPSSAAEDAVAVVTFDVNADGEIAADEYQEFNDIVAAFDYAAEIKSSTAENQIYIKLLDDVVTTGEALAICQTKLEDGIGFPFMTFDLNGHLWTGETISIAIYPFANLTITDSNPDALHYVKRVENDGNWYYQCYSATAAKPLDSYLEVRGGIISAEQSLSIELYNGNNLTINAGTFLGQGQLFGGSYSIYDEDTKEEVAAMFAAAGVAMKGSITLNGGMVQIYRDEEVLGEQKNVGVGLYYGTILEINGGTLYGEITNNDFDGNTSIVELDQLTDSSPVKIGKNTELSTDTTTGMKVYTAVDTTTDQPTTTPTDPIVEQPATNNTNNMIGIIVLGAATVVMLAGVGAAIGITVKRRKRKAA